MNRIDTDELLHVYDAHTANETRTIEGDEEEYSREELLLIITTAREEMKSFCDKWLVPAIAELDNSRVVIAKINDMTDT